MLSLIAMLSLGASSDALLFNAGDRGWLVMSRAGEVVRYVEKIDGRRTDDAAISLDGKKWAFISEGSLFLWQDGWPRAREVARAGNVVKSPAFSPDGVWLYFIQNDFESMRALGPKASYQMWRVRAGGGAPGAPEKLTNSQGCHMWPAPTASGGAVFTRMNPNSGAGRDIEVLSSKGVETPVRGFESEHGEASPDLGGERVAFVRLYPGEPKLVVLTLKGQQESQWAQLPWRTTRLRPAWGADGQTVWVQNQDGVWRVKRDGTVTEHIAFSKAAGAK